MQRPKPDPLRFECWAPWSSYSSLLGHLGIHLRPQIRKPRVSSLCNTPSRGSSAAHHREPAMDYIYIFWLMVQLSLGGFLFLLGSPGFLFWGEGGGRCSPACLTPHSVPSPVCVFFGGLWWVAVLRAGPDWFCPWLALWQGAWEIPSEGVCLYLLLFLSPWRTLIHTFPWEHYLLAEPPSACTADASSWLGTSFLNLHLRSSAGFLLLTFWHVVHYTLVAQLNAPSHTLCGIVSVASKGSSVTVRPVQSLRPVPKSAQSLVRCSAVAA